MEEKNNKKNYLIMGICIILAIIFGILIGLVYSNKDVIFKNNTSVNETNNKSANDNTKTPNTTEKITEEKRSKDKSDSANQNVTYSTKDNLVIDELNTTLNKIDSQNSGTSFTESAKSTFITLVDFIFYDGTIKGVTFNELTDAGKQKVLELASKIDNTLEQKSPGYKDKISDTTKNAMNKASKIIKDNAQNMENFTKEALGEENYQAIINASEKIKQKSKDAINFVQDSGSKILNETKDKLDKWYQNFKNNN